MSLEEFDSIINRMQTAFEYSLNLGQNIEAAKILFQMNEQLPEALQLHLEEIENPDQVSRFISKYKSEIKSAIFEYRQQLMS